jgi:hypothetical protein
LPEEKDCTSLISLSTCRKITILKPCSTPMQIFPAQDNIRHAMGRTILQTFHLRLRINGDAMVVKNAKVAREFAIFSNTLDIS